MQKVVLAEAGAVNRNAAAASQLAATEPRNGSACIGIHGVAT